MAELYRRHTQTAIRFARLVVRDPYLAEDVAQQAMLKTFRAMSQFQQRSSFRTWLYRITVNEAISLIRRRVNRESPAPFVQVAPGNTPDTPEETLDRKAQRQAVRDAITRLDPALRTAVFYRYYLDLSESEIASRLGCPVGTIKSRLHRARAQLRTLLPVDER